MLREYLQKSRLTVWIVMLLFCAETLFAIGYDTGMVTWSQPNNVTFTARSWGDEFQGWMETNAGYRIALNPQDGYYYYAILDAKGEYTPSSNKVGIDPPLASSYQLERSSSRQAEIDSMIAAFELDLEQSKADYLQRRADALANQETINYHCGVILVEFTDTTHYVSLPPPDGTRENGYYIEDFEKMLFGSPGEWYAPEDTLTSPHPEHDLVYGSMRDYFYQQSIPNGLVGSLELTGEVINPPVDSLAANPIPQWIQLDNARSYYENTDAIRDEAVEKALSLGWLSNDPCDEEGTFDHIIIIYAGLTIFDTSNWLNPRYSCKRYIMGERQKKGANSEHIFSNIGTHAHEFGHRLGLPDVGNVGGNSLKFGLMHSQGGVLGPQRNHACPSSIEPFLRIDCLYWVTPIDTLTENASNFVVEYDYDVPRYHRLEPAFSDEYFLIETRGREGFDQYTPLYDDLDQQDGALLIWRNGKEIIPADNFFGLGHVNDFYPTLDSTSQNWNDLTDASSNLSSGGYSHIALQDIIFNYEADNTDTSTTIGEILFDYALLSIETNTTWSGTVNLNTDMRISAQATLTIDPGTVILVDTVSANEDIKIQIEDGASIVANGTEAAPITFKTIAPASANDAWEGFEFSDGSRGTFHHTFINQTQTPFVGNFSSGGYLKLLNSTILGGDITVDYADTNTIVSDCLFESNDDIDISHSSIQIMKNEFLGGTGIDLVADSSTILNNVFEGAGTGQGIFISSTGTSTTLMQNNTFANYTWGVQTSGSQHNTIVLNNIFYLNTFSDQSLGTATYNNFWNDDSATFQLPDTTNISEYPGFVNADSSDFHLLSTSPCIDRGDTLSDYSNEPSPNGGRINMGAYGNTAEATLTFDQIVEANLTADTTWSGYVNILNDISTNGNALTVLKNTRVLFDDGVTLTIDSDLRAGPITGVPSGSDSTVFSGYREKDTMGGLLVMAGSVDTLFMRYTHFNKANSAVTIQGELGGTTAMDSSLLEFLTFEDNTTGLYLSRVEVRVDSSTFRNNKDGIIASQSDLDLFGSLLEDNNRRGLYLNHSEMKIKGNTFDDNGINGVMFKYSSTGS